jgi:hypothetical protein
MYFKFSNLLEENRIVTYLVTRKWAVHKQWCQISWFGSKFHCLTIKMLYNSCTGIYKFGNNTYTRRIRSRSNLGHIFRGRKKCVLWAGKYGLFVESKPYISSHIYCTFYVHVFIYFVNTQKHCWTWRAVRSFEGSVTRTNATLWSNVALSAGNMASFCKFDGDKWVVIGKACCGVPRRT